MCCYCPSFDPARPFRPTALVRALVAHDAIVRRDVLRALDAGHAATGGDERCTWGEAEGRAATPIARHVVAVMARDAKGAA